MNEADLVLMRLKEIMSAQVNCGFDWLIHSPWCTDEYRTLCIGLVRHRGEKALGKPKLGTFSEVLDFVANEASVATERRNQEHGTSKGD